MDTGQKLQSVEQNFFELKQQLQSIAGTLPDPIFIIDEFGKYMEVIGGTERSILHSGKFFIGKYLHDLLPENLADSLMQTIAEAIADNTLKTFEYQLGPEDMPGSPLEGPLREQWFEGRIHPIKDKNDEVHSVIWLTSNITQLKNLEEQLKALSEKDGLTNAYNRKHFMHIFEQEFAIAKRYKHKFSVLLIDIDNLKNINEAYGHDCGDTVLKRFVVFCDDTLRQSDLFARYGGGEFIAMLPNTPSLGAAIIAERIRTDFEKSSFTYEKQNINITISIGISLALDTDKNSSAVLNRANTALYQAKKKGRNRVEIS